MVKIREEVNVDTYVDVDVEISVQDFYNQLTGDDVAKLVGLLLDDGYILGGTYTPGSRNPMDEEWEESLSKLFSNRLRLSNDDVETIIKISNKI